MLTVEILTWLAEFYVRMPVGFRPTPDDMALMIEHHKRELPAYQSAMLVHASYTDNPSRGRFD